MLASVLQHPRHAPVHLSGRDRLALTEEQKYEYAVRLQSLGRSRDMDTKRWTALDLWHDPAVKVSQKGIADLVGVTPKTINVWVKEDEQQRQAEKNYQSNSSPTEREQPLGVALRRAVAHGRERGRVQPPRQHVVVDDGQPHQPRPRH